MYVCLCYGITADEIRQQSAQGASVQDIQDTLKAGKCCGCCMDEVKSVHCHAQKTHCANKLPQAA